MSDDNIAENYLLLFDDDDDDDEKGEKKGDRKGHKNARRPRDAATQRRSVPPAIPTDAATSGGSARRTTATGRRMSLWSRFWRWLRHG